MALIARTATLGCSPAPSQVGTFILERVKKNDTFAFYIKLPRRKGTCLLVLSDLPAPHQPPGLTPPPPETEG